MRDLGPVFGFSFPCGTEVALFVMKNKYKLALLVQDTTGLLALLCLMPRGKMANFALRKLLPVVAFLRYFSIDPATGSLVPLERSDMNNLLYLVGVMIALELIKYE